MNWQTVYDISGDGARDFSGYLIAGAGVLALAAVFALRARRRGERSGTARVLALFALVIAGLGYGVNSWDQNRLTAALETGAVQQVAGAIRHHAVWREDVTPAGSGPGATRHYRNWERISVGGVDFIWTPGADQAGFTHAPSPPLDIRDGLWLRVTYVEDAPDEATQRRIVKLERGDAPPDMTPWGRPEAVLPGAPYPSVVRMPGP
ncbi:hypothetical protein [Methyloversatilis thermotolerans]|uniref:hypothetical protein n=1 Tax=Methyloversatilis thermotolerans TaxID=1346290 RepID=UPI00036C8CBA|nr:hypothetical protein [Methyloversatilis thermotolerans]